MGYLNNSVVTVDAILTKKGRELLARGDGSFRITQFALADDEIDYTLYNTSHPSGSAYYGEAIENMPLLEAFPDETQVMKYKLTTLPRGTAKLPILEAGYASITLKQGASLTITPQTLNFLGTSQAYESSGYTVMIADVRLLSNFTGVGIQTSESERLNQTTTLGTNVSKTVIGTSINISGTTINTLYGASSNTLTSTITIIGRDSGARITIPIKITKVN
ncbi:MAG: hypothetical protein ACKVJK_03985 [Methylophagaceae bacterium]|jgi:hypothetical protein|tara:strand:- start:171 stop:830 length:660 start_codon:yes stop_codon:yes gene_type:complete